MTPEVSCDVASRWLSRAIDEEITPEEERLLDSHLDSCSHCRSERVRLFSEVEWLESGLGRVSDEIEGLFRERIGNEPISVAERAALAEESLPRTRPQWPLLLAAVAVLSVVAAFLTRQTQSEIPTVLVEWGPGGIEHSTGGRVATLGGEGAMSLPVEGRIKLPVGSEAWVTFPDGSYSRFGEQSELRIDSLGEQVVVELLSGRAAFQIEPREEIPFVILTSVARIEVVGTQFGVIHENQRTIVTVTEGEVAVRRRYSPEMDPFRLGPESKIELTKDSTQYSPGKIFSEERGPDPNGGSGQGASGPVNGSGQAGSKAAPNPFSGPPGASHSSSAPLTGADSKAANGRETEAGREVETGRTAETDAGAPSGGKSTSGNGRALDWPNGGRGAGGVDPDEDHEPDE